MPDFIPPKTINPKSITPQQEKEPPKEVLEQTFKMDSSLVSNGDGLITIDDKKVETKKEGADTTTTTNEPKKQDDQKIVSKEVEKKAEPSPILKPPVEGKKEPDKKVGDKESVKLITPPDKSTKSGAGTARDYTGFSEQETAVLKQMSNEAFEFSSKLIKESKELSKLKDSSFLQHPEAYTLSPDYRNTQSQVYMAGVEANAWKSALILCKEGKPFKYPTSVDQKTGELVMSADVEPTQSAEIELQNYMQKAMNVGQQLQGQLTNMSQTFKQRVEGDNKYIQDERAKRFAWVNDPKLLDYTMNVEGLGEMSIKDIRQQIKSILPAYRQNDILAEVVADLMVSLRIQDAELQAAKNGQSTAEVKAEEAKRGEPSSEIRKGKEPDAINGVNTFSLEGLPK